MSMYVHQGSLLYFFNANPQLFPQQSTVFLLSPILSPVLSAILAGMLCPPLSGLVFLLTPSGLGCCVCLPGLVFSLSLVLSPILFSSWFGMLCPCSGACLQNFMCGLCNCLGSTVQLEKHAHAHTNLHTYIPTWQRNILAFLFPFVL